MADAGETTQLSDVERGERLQELTKLLDMMRPAVQSDGGDLVLVSADVEHGVVEVMLQGSCSSCAISATTLQAGGDRLLNDRLDWETDVRGGGAQTAALAATPAPRRGARRPQYDLRPAFDR